MHSVLAETSILVEPNHSVVSVSAHCFTVCGMAESCYLYWLFASGGLGQQAIVKELGTNIADLIASVTGYLGIILFWNCNKPSISNASHIFTCFWAYA